MLPNRRARVRYPPIDRWSGGDRGELERAYIAANRPVVLAACSAGWVARWAPEALKADFGSALVEAEETRQVYVGERAREHIPLRDLIDASLADDTSRRWKGLDFLARVPGMRERLDASPPPLDAWMPAARHGLQRTLWIAPARTMSSLHHDANFNNLNLQVSGQKTFLLIPPGSDREVYRYGSSESPVNPFTPDLARFPRFSGARPLEATLSPGDALLVPKYWWHCVYTARASVNLSTFFVCPSEMSPWRAQAGVPLVHRVLATVAAELKRNGQRDLAVLGRRAWVFAHRRLVPRVEPQPRGALTDPS